MPFELHLRLKPFLTVGDWTGDNLLRGNVSPQPMKSQGPWKGEHFVAVATSEALFLRNFFLGVLQLTLFISMSSSNTVAEVKMVLHHNTFA